MKGIRAEGVRDFGPRAMSRPWADSCRSLASGSPKPLPGSLTRRTHRTQHILILTAKVYFNKRIRSSISKQNRYVGQTPEATRGAQCHVVSLLQPQSPAHKCRTSKWAALPAVPLQELPLVLLFCSPFMQVRALHFSHGAFMDWPCILPWLTAPLLSFILQSAPCLLSTTRLGPGNIKSLVTW